MGGRLVDWLGSGTAAARPSAATVNAAIVPNSTALYFATDTSILGVLDQSGPTWFDIDVGSLSAIAFSTLPDVDWSTPPTDGQVFVWDTTSSKLIPTNVSIAWGDVTGTLGDQTDLQSALDDKVSFTAGVGDWVGYHKLDDAIGYYADYSATGALISFDMASTVGGIWMQNAAGTQWLTYGYGINGNSRFQIDGSHAFEFTSNPYVGANVIWHAGNLTPYTDGMADARIAAASIDDLSDVDITTTPPANGDTLVWDTDHFEPGAGGGGGTGFEKIGADATVSGGVIDFPDTDFSAYTMLMIVIETITVTTDDSNIQFQFRLDNALVTSGYRYRADVNSSGGTSDASASTSTTGIFLTTTTTNWKLGNASGKSLSGVVEIYAPAAAMWKQMTYRGNHPGPSGNVLNGRSAGHSETITPFTGFRILGSSNLTGGVARVYGLPK